jgi:ribosomal protein S18 acetylase RimI-like enzyme
VAVDVQRLGSGDNLAAATVLLTRFFAEEGFATPPETIAANVRRMAGLEVCALLLVRMDGEPAGVATVSLDFGIEYGWSAEMGDLYVDPRFRCRGVARSLMAAAEVFCRARGASGLGVTVTAEAEARHGLTRFYQALGFTGEGRRLLWRDVG